MEMVIFLKKEHMDINSILEEAEADFKDRQQQLPVKKPIRPTGNDFKAKMSAPSAPPIKAMNLPPKPSTPVSPEQIKPEQKIIDTTKDAKRINTEMVDANKGKIDESKKNISDNKPISQPKDKLSSAIDKAPKIDFNKDKGSPISNINFKGVAKKLSSAVKSTADTISKGKTAMSRFKDTKTGKVALGAGSLAAGGLGGVGLASKKASEVKK
jgi:hypothetical protein